MITSPRTAKTERRNPTFRDGHHNEEQRRRYLNGAVTRTRFVRRQRTLSSRQKGRERVWPTKEPRVWPTKGPWISIRVRWLYAATNGVEFSKGQFSGSVVGVAHNLLHLSSGGRLACTTVCLVAAVNRFARLRNPIFRDGHHRRCSLGLWRGPSRGVVWR
jgi:hypothetical protein